jgi:hypothetical protein
MQSRNKPTPSSAERRHIERIKGMACVVCDAPGPSEAHEPEQGLWFASMPLCVSCHRGPLGWHGTKALWRVRKLDELKALAKTVEMLMEM